MINKSDWQAVHDSLTAADREKLGEPPTAEDLLAYENGTLPECEMKRVRRLLVAYPELARAFATPFPDDDAKPGDADYLSSDAVERQLARFQKQVRPAASHAPAQPRDRGRSERGRVLQFWRASAAIAAALAVVFGTLLMRKELETRQPRVDSGAQVLTSGATRGSGEGVVVNLRGDSCLLAVVLDAADYAGYRLELVNAAGRNVWTREPVAPPIENMFYVTLPASMLPSGGYKLVVSGLRGNAREPVATYPFEVRRGR
jgi:anti-sigma-K factor RskA